VSVCGVARHQRDELGEVLVLEERLGQWDLRVELVRVAAAVLRSPDVPGLLEIREDPKGGTLGYPRDLRDLRDCASAILGYRE